MSEWITNGAARLDEMSGRKLSLCVEVDAHRDITVSILTDGVPIEDKEKNKARLIFCSLTNGGGRSPHTRLALLKLLEAMKEDAKGCPDGIPEHPEYIVELMIKGK